MAFPTNDKQASDDLLLANAHVKTHIFNFINSFSLKCAIQLGIPDIIHKYEKPMPLPELVQALSINQAKEDHIRRLMRLLIHSGFFVENSEGYALTSSSRLLLRDNPFGVTPHLLAILDPVFTDPWHQFSNWFTNDGPDSLFESFHGKPLWEFASNEPRINHSFNEAMAGETRLTGSLVITKCKDVFEGVDSLIDVGGGTGTMAKYIAKAFPTMFCTVLDLPHVVEGLEGSNNLSFLAGDMFAPLPTTDAFLLKSILHDWTDDKCVEILKRCREALPSKGKVIIMDMVVDEKKKDEVQIQLLYDMHLMTVLNGKERNEKEWAKLFFDAGFTVYKIYRILGMKSLIEVIR